MPAFFLQSCKVTKLILGFSQATSLQPPAGGRPPASLAAQQTLTFVFPEKVLTF